MKNFRGLSLYYGHRENSTILRFRTFIRMHLHFRSSLPRLATILSSIPDYMQKMRRGWRAHASCICPPQCYSRSIIPT